MHSQVVLDYYVHGSTLWERPSLLLTNLEYETGIQNEDEIRGFLPIMPLSNTLGPMRLKVTVGKIC